MKSLNYIFVLGILLSFMACNGSDSKADNTENDSKTDTTSNSSAQQTTGDLKAKTTKMTMEGTLQIVEDAGYPMAYISVSEDNSEGIIQYDFNQEDGKGLKIEKMNALLGKKVIVSYERTEFLDAFDILLNGKTILERPTGTTCFKEIKGILNAPEATKGDLPSPYSIKTADNTIYNFETFITPAMVAANAKEVSACLIKAEKINLLSIKAK